MSIVIIDYGSGNLRSAAKAFERANNDIGARTRIVVSADPDCVAAADRIVLPGVGAYGDCMDGLTAIDGMVEALTQAVRKRAQPFLGICVGMQLLATQGHEHGAHPGLDWIAGDVVALEPAVAGLKIPHMGWNTLDFDQADHPILQDFQGSTPHAYFVHSYQFQPEDLADVLGTTEYGGKVNAIVGRDNLFGTQFHPEKSQAFGLQLIANFLRWRP
jgi:glutamine amidotransferase